MPNTTKTVGPRVFPTGTQQYQPSKKGTGNKETISTSTHNQTDPTGDTHHLTSDMTWLTTAEDSSKWDAAESVCIGSRLKQPALPTTPITATTTTQLTTHDRQATGTIKTRDQTDDDTKDDDEQDDDTLLSVSQFKRQLNLHHSKANTSSALVQKAAKRISHDTLMLSATHILPSTDARPLDFKRQKI